MVLATLASAMAPARIMAASDAAEAAAPAATDEGSLAAMIRDARTASEELAARIDRRAPAWRALVGDAELVWDIDPERRLVFAGPAHDAAIRARVRAEAAAVVDAALPLLFGAPPAEPVLVVVAEDRLAPTLIGAGAHVGGRYVHADRILAVREIGVSLRHELVHALHFGHMERLGMRQAHAFWIQEGLAALFETWDPVPAAAADAPADAPADPAAAAASPPARRFTPGDRDAIARRLAEAGGLDSLASLAALDGRGFMQSARRHYAVSRAAMLWLADRGVLSDWYRRLGDGAAAEDGLRAMAGALGVPQDELDAAFRDWLRQRPPAVTERTAGGAWLGVDRYDSFGAVGLRILRVARHGPARSAGLRGGDVVLEVDGAVTPTEAELRRLLARRQPGETVQLTLRRRGEPLVLPLELGAWDPQPGRRRGSSR